ncbi:hypothetical protein OAG36_00700 [bacterium]|nr:hypothetical protein [bacterium]
MRVGTLCFATERGLGYLAKSFYDNGVVTDFAVLYHGQLDTHPEWYPNCIEITKRPFLNDELKRFILNMDIMLFFETPFDWDIIHYCREHNVRTIILSMYECTPRSIPADPDMWWCPSLLDMEYFGDNKSLVQIPVDGVTWKERNVAKTFIHNAGYIGLKGRNGTLELLQAMQYVQSDIELKVRCQTEDVHKILRKVPNVISDERVDIFIGTLPREDVWGTGDVAVQPEKWNGMSLPLQESYASGLLVMTTERFPMTDWLPNEPMIPVQSFRKNRVANRCMEFDEAMLDPVDIADTIDHWYGRDITNYSTQGKDWAEENTWEIIKPDYTKLLEELL